MENFYEKGNICAKCVKRRQDLVPHFDNSSPLQTNPPVAFHPDLMLDLLKIFLSMHL